MSTQAALRLTNIVSITQGAVIFAGVRSVNIKADKGKLQAILKEGDLYPTGAENLGTPEFPVTTEATFETDHASMLAMLAAAVGTLVIIYKVVAGGSNQTVTIVNHQFKNFGLSQNLQDFGKPSVNGGAFSADGAALPISVA